MVTGSGTLCLSFFFFAPLTSICLVYEEKKTRFFASSRRCFNLKRAHRLRMDAVSRDLRKLAASRVSNANNILQNSARSCSMFCKPRQSVSLFDCSRF